MATGMDVNEKAIQYLESNALFLQQRRRNMVVFTMRMFLLGVEYSIVTPSLWFYLKTFDSKPWLFGVVITSYSATSMLATPLFGKTFDKTLNNRGLIVASTVPLIMGNLVYSFSYSAWFVVLGRLLAGVGDGFTPVAAAEIAQTATTKERTKAIACLEGGRILGAVVGPVLNLGLARIDFQLGTWRVFYGPVPGVFMCLSWVLFELITFRFTHNNAKWVRNIMEKINADDSSDVIPTNAVEHDMSTEVNGSSVRQRLVLSSQLKRVVRWRDVLGAIQPPVASVMALGLLVFLIQRCVEALVPLAGPRDIAWTEDTVSVLYSVGACLVIMVIVAMFKMAALVADKHFIMVSCVFSIVVALALAFYQGLRHSAPYNTVLLLFIFITEAVVLPVNLIAPTALLTKVVSSEVQGSVQGLYLFVVRFGVTVAPVTVSALFNELHYLAVVLLPATLALSLLFHRHFYTR